MVVSSVPLARFVAPSRVASPYPILAAPSEPRDAVTLPALSASDEEPPAAPSGLASAAATAAVILAGALSSLGGAAAPAFAAYSPPSQALTMASSSSDVHIISNVDATEGVIEPFATADLGQLQAATSRNPGHVTVDVAIEREAHPTAKLLTGGAVMGASTAPLGLAVYVARKHHRGAAAAIALGLAGLAGSYAVGSQLNFMHDGVATVVSALADRSSAEGVWSGREVLHMADGKRAEVSSSGTSKVDPKQIGSFIAERMKAYPAGTVVIQLTGHGLMYRHVSGVDGKAFPGMIADATRQAGRPIDVLVLESCLAGNLETLNAIAPNVRYAVVSEESIAAGVVGPTFENTAAKIAGQAVTPRALSTTMAAEAKGQPGAPTLAVVDMAKIPPLVSSVDRLGADLAAEVKDGRTVPIQAALDATTVYPQDELPLAQRLAVGDLQQFAQKIQAAYPGQPIAADAGSVLTALRQATIGLNVSARYAGTGGISIQLPGKDVGALEKKAGALAAQGVSSYAEAASPAHWRDFVTSMSASEARAGGSTEVHVVPR